MKLSGVSAIVTGGASGLGAGAALALKQAGARVAILDASRETGEAFGAEHELPFFQADVTRDEEIARAFELARAEQGVERILVCCAGIASVTPTAWIDPDNGCGTAIPIEDFERVIQVNLIGSMRCAAKSAAAMIECEPLDADGSRGVLLFTGSIASTDGVIGQTAYAASKAGIEGMLLPMARDLGRYGVRAAAIHPGAFVTPMADRLPKEVWDRFVVDTPFPKRRGTAAEFGACVVDVCENQFLNAVAIRLDAGVRMRGDVI